MAVDSNTSPEFKGIKTANFAISQQRWDSNTSPEFKGIKTSCFYHVICPKINSNTSPEFKGIKTFDGCDSVGQGWIQIPALNSKGLRPSLDGSLSAVRDSNTSPEFKGIKTFTAHVFNNFSGIQIPALNSKGLRRLTRCKCEGSLFKYQP